MVRSPSISSSTRSAGSPAPAPELQTDLPGLHGGVQFGAVALLDPGEVLAPVAQRYGRAGLVGQAERRFDRAVAAADDQDPPAGESPPSPRCRRPPWPGPLPGRRAGAACPAGPWPAPRGASESLRRRTTPRTGQCPGRSAGPAGRCGLRARCWRRLSPTPGAGFPWTRPPPTDRRRVESTAARRRGSCGGDTCALCRRESPVPARV